MGDAPIVRVGRRWVRDGQSYRTREDAAAGARPLPPQVVRERDPIDWDAVVRQRDAPPLPATQMRRAFTLSTSWGETLTGKAGDWRVGAEGDQWIVGEREFAATYTPAGDGTFAKTGWAFVKRVDRPFVVHTREGLVEGRAGDYLLEGPLGDRWRIAAERYAAKGYVPIDELPAGTLPPPIAYPEAGELRWVRQRDGGYTRGRARIVRERDGWLREGRRYLRLADAKAAASD